MNKKIIDIEELSKKLKEIRIKRKMTIGLSHGVFDLVHLGHIFHFNEAKKKVDILIVSVTSDKYVFKGPGRPFFSQEQRMEVISNLESVDYVTLSDSDSSLNIINSVKPNIYFKGPDYKDNSKDFTKKIIQENNLVKRNKGITFYTSAKKYSSTLLLNKLSFKKTKNNLAIKKIKKNFSFEKIKKIIDSLNHVKPFVIGEIIIDKYVFCEALGKSGKEPMLVLRDIFEELYLGGSGAIANHISAFCKKIFLLGMIGEKKEKLEFIHKNIKPGIIFNYICKKKSPTIIKKRYLDSISKSKIFGVYSLNDCVITQTENKNLMLKFLRIKNKTDLTILSDYGHGFISKTFSRKLIKQSKFIAVNAQINAANFGHHSLENYHNVDFMIINENELKHEMRSKSDKIHKLMKSLCNKLKIKFLAVTRGSSGVILYNKSKNSFYYSEAFADKIVDKVGAGDTMLSILSICLYKNIDPDLSLLISSFCAAQSVKSIGNKFSLDKSILLKDLQHYLT
jgi:rfaE bifunctional protein kinase chain/domain/rfaE bifunctional protein nucleotidyltransferase chain/domain